MSDIDILVAGGGSVGLAAAAALAVEGFAVTVLDRAPAPPPLAVAAAGEVDLRVYALSPASIALLTRLDVWPAIAAARASPYQAMQVWQGEVSEALSFDAAPGATLGAIVEHGVLNAGLWVQPGHWQRRAEAAINEVLAEEGAVQATLASGETLRARLLVVADGPESPLRAQLGIDSLGWDYAQRAIVCHVATERAHGGVARQRFLPTGPLALLPLADGRSSVVWSCHAGLAQELLALDAAAFCLRLTQASGGVLGLVRDTTARQSFPLRLKQVLQPAVPGAVVIGDAAHVVHPLAGQGANLGLADAEALAATLGAARAAGRGWWRARTLASYTRQRQADTLEMAAMTDGLHRAFTRGGPTLRRALGLGMELVNRIEPAKQFFATRAQGL